MGDVLVLAGFAVALAAVLVGLWRLGLRVRRHGGDFMGPFDELWHPAAHRFRLEIREYEQRMAPMPPPDDRWRRGRTDPDPVV
jgi:hypothetical protein